MAITIKKFGDPAKGVANGIDMGNIEICSKVLAQAKVLAPVADKFGGTLRNSGMWRTDKDEGGFNDKSGVQADKRLETKPGKFQGIVGFSVDYSPYVEFGTRKMVSQPYLRPAIDLVVKAQSAKEVIAKLQREEMAEALRKGVKVARFK